MEYGARVQTLSKRKEEGESRKNKGDLGTDVEAHVYSRGALLGLVTAFEYEGSPSIEDNISLDCLKQSVFFLGSMAAESVDHI